MAHWGLLRQIKKSVIFTVSVLKKYYKKDIDVKFLQHLREELSKSHLGPRRW